MPIKGVLYVSRMYEFLCAGGVLTLPIQGDDGDDAGAEVVASCEAESEVDCERYSEGDTEHVFGVCPLCSLHPLRDGRHTLMVRVLASGRL